MIYVFSLGVRTVMETKGQKLHYPVIKKLTVLVLNEEGIPRRFIWWRSYFLLMTQKKFISFLKEMSDWFIH